jgi:hypothetical protein
LWISWLSVMAGMRWAFRGHSMPAGQANFVWGSADWLDWPRHSFGDDAPVPTGDPAENGARDNGAARMVPGPMARMVPGPINIEDIGPGTFFGPRQLKGRIGAAR